MPDPDRTLQRIEFTKNGVRLDTYETRCDAEGNPDPSGGHKLITVWPVHPRTERTLGPPVQKEVRAWTTSRA